MANTKSKRNTLIYGAISLLGVALLATVGVWWWLRDTAPDMSRPWTPAIHGGISSHHPSRPYELEELFLKTDVIARVRLLGVEEVIKSPGENEAYGAYMQFKFEALEYLKGGYGYSPIWANVALEQAEGDTEEEARWKAKYYFERRSTLDDAMDAIVFMWDNDLQGRQDHFGLGRFSSESGESYSLGAHGNWLPSMSAIEAAGASDEDEFFLEYTRSGASGASGGSISADTVSMAHLRRLASLSDVALERRINSLSGFMVVDESLPSETGIDHLSARTRPNWIELIWQTSFNAPDVTGYRILRRKQTDSEFIELANIPITEEGYYQDMRDIQPETKYIYRLRAYGASGDIADARIAITTVAALEPLSGAAATATPTASPTPPQPTATVVPTATTPAAIAPTPTPYPERTLPINLTQTIGGFTVELTAIKDTADGIEIKKSYQTNIPLENYLSVGSPEIRYSNGVTESEFDAYLPAPGEEVDISLGSFIVADTGLSGVVDIPLSSRAENGDLSPQPELLVGSKRYAITSLLSAETQTTISVKPLNQAAQYGIVGVGANAPVDAILSDGAGKSYNFFFGSMEFHPFNQALEKQTLVFAGIDLANLPSSEVLTLTIRGAGNVVGPFVFENVHVVSETAPVETPQVPGGPGAGEATTTPVSAIDPTATPES